MRGGQVAALVFAILLLLPGGCFLFVGIGMTISSSDSIERSLGPLALVIGLGLAALIALLFWVALRRRHAPPPKTDSPPL